MSRKKTSSRKKEPKKTEEGSKKIYDNLQKVIVQFMSGQRYKPMGQLAIFKQLQLPANLHDLCKQILADLVEEGTLEIVKKQFSLKKPKVETMTGTLRVHQRGFGFVIPDDAVTYVQDIFIPKHLTENAVDGDKVEVLVNEQSQSEKGPEGKVVAILKRGRTHLAGTIHQLDARDQAFAYVPLLGSNKRVLVKYDSDEALNVGDRVILEVVDWSETPNEDTVCKLSHIIGHINDPSGDVACAIEEFAIRNDFPKKALEEAKAFGKTIKKADQKKRVDLTDLPAITIDPETARDFDDALSISKDKKGHYFVGVHIADVAHYVPEGSALDIEAKERCNSTYFPGRCVPMLPEELSNNLCSLRPKEIRLTASVLMEFDKEGTLLKHEIVRGFINSRKRFTYEEAKLVLDGKKKSVHSKSLKLMVEMCHLLKKKRHQRGSIDFGMPEFVIIIDEKGYPIGTKWVEYDITHQLVEEFMLKANEVVAKDITDRGKTLLYRVHEEPSEENIKDFHALARSLGFKLLSEPTTEDIQKLFEEAKNTPFAQQLSVSFIRSMKLASYSPENIGHFGLSLEHYCHFTSPIRRYSDLITQRLLFDEESKNLDLEKAALKCSEQERVSFKAESSVKLLKKLRLLEKFLKEDPTHEFEGVITKIKPFGVYFELANMNIEGFLHISELENDYFIYLQDRNILRGRSSGKIYTAGEKVKVNLVAINLIFLESKWTLLTARKKRSH